MSDGQTDGRHRRGGDVVAQVKRANDLVSVMGEYVELQRAGGNYKVCCPFHTSKHGGIERTPSLHVYPDKQSWICYGAGCGRGGSVFDFVMEIEGVDFGGALRQLAKRANIELDQGPRKPRPAGEVGRDQLIELLGEAERFYRDQYRGSEAEAYVNERGIDARMQLEFGIGFAPDGWDSLVRALQPTWGMKPLIQAGLVVERETRSGGYDRFRRRLMIPIRNARGQTLGFGGRKLRPEDEPKYINTPQTDVYHKSHVLFGLDRARDALRTEKSAIVMEGYTDVILAHQFGIKTAIATCGTAMTEGHLDMLGQARTLTILFDGDEPGIMAAERTLAPLIRRQIDARIVILPDDLDPADYLLARGAEAFLEALGVGEQPIAFKCRRARAAHDLSSPLGRQKAAEECLDLVAEAQSAIFRHDLARVVAEHLEVPEAVLTQELERRIKRRNRRGPRRDAGDVPTGTSSGQPGRPGATDFDAGGTTAPASADLPEITGVGAPSELEEMLIACVCLRAEFASQMLDALPPADVGDAELRAIVAAVNDLTADRGVFEIGDLLSELAPGPRRRLVGVLKERVGESFDETGKFVQGNDDDDLLFRPKTLKEVFADCLDRLAARREHDATLTAALGERARIPAATRVQRIEGARTAPGRAADGIDSDSAHRHLELLRARMKKKKKPGENADRDNDRPAEPPS
jgi:DNA primase